MQLSGDTWMEERGDNHDGIADPGTDRRMS